MIHTIVLHPIIKALCTASTFLGIQNPSPHDWKAINPTQKHFLEQHAPEWKELSSFTETELKGFASTNISELNHTLKKEGFSIQLSPLQNDHAFSIISILDVILTWKQKGEQGILKSANTHKEYPCVIMESGFNIFTSSIHKNPIIRLTTKSNDTAWITVGDKPCEDLDLNKRINEIRNSTLKKCVTYNAIRFPMVDLNHEEDISWLKGIMLEKHPIAHALQQTKFKMNTEGAHIKSAVALGMEINSPIPKNEIVIDKPFYIWIERPGLSKPYFVGYITEEYWKDPKNLDL